MHLQAPPRRERIVLPEKDVVVEVEADDGEVAEIRVLGVQGGGGCREETRSQLEQIPSESQHLQPYPTRLVNWFTSK